MGSRRLLVIVWVWAVVAVGALGASLVGSGNAATLGTLTVTSGTKVEQNKSALTVTARVQGLFTNPGTATINGSSSTFDPGTGTFGTPAPAFATYAAGAANTSSWFGTGNANDSVVRSGGSNYSVALVPGWRTVDGVDDAGRDRIDDQQHHRRRHDPQRQQHRHVRRGRSGQLHRDRAHFDVCGWAVRRHRRGDCDCLWLGRDTQHDERADEHRHRSFTSAPGASGDDLTATFTRTGGGGGTSPTTITCDPATPVTGSYAGFISFAVSSTTYYDNFLVAYS